LKVGDSGDAYSAFTTIFSGYIENDTTNWDRFSVNLQDIRAGLTQPIASNLLTLTDYPHLNESNENKVKPVAYGDIYGAECICLNEDETASTYTFLLCDTEFNNVYSLNKVLVEGVDQTANATLNASAGTFTLATAYYDPGDTVTADFTVNIKNGVDIIKDLIANYDDKPYLASFWNLTETAIAQAISRNTSLYVDNDKKLSKCIESICFDIDGLFFSKDNGLYTVRIYDENRTPVRTIKTDEFLYVPEIENEGSQYLTSAIIKYKKNISDDTYLQIENRDYEAAAFDVYKRYKVETFETMLTTSADANLKAQTILDYSSSVPSVVKRRTKFQNVDLEIMDFIICSPFTRYGAKEQYGIYEIIGITKDFSKYEIELTLKFVDDYPYPVDVVYEVLIDESGEYITDESGDTIAMR
jgi:hypothetical protein